MHFHLLQHFTQRAALVTRDPVRDIYTPPRTQVTLGYKNNCAPGSGSAPDRLRVGSGSAPAGAASFILAVEAAETAESAQEPQSEACFAELAHQ